MGYNPDHFSFGRVKTNRKCTVLSTLMVCALPVVLVVEMFFWSWFFKLPCFFKGKYEKKKLKKVRTTVFWWHCQAWNATMNMFIYLRFNHFNQTLNYEEDIERLDRLIIIPSSANPTKLSNTLKQFVGNFPTNCLSAFDHFVILTLKGLYEEIYPGESRRDI